MKKLKMLVMSLLALSFLANCGESKTKYCNVTTEGINRLYFSTTKGKPLNKTKAIMNKDFTFRMKINNVSNDTVYKLPTTLNIYIGDSDIKLASGYTITETVQYTEAMVKIDKSNIVGDIKIVGEGIPVDYYAVDVISYGVKNNFTDPYVAANTDSDIAFSEETAGGGFPGAENIYINVDNKGWVSPADGSSEYFSYDTDNHILRIIGAKVNSNVIIRARSPKHKLLESLSWKEISNYSLHGWASYIFYIGEEKTVIINNQPHKVRIIGFNQDKDSKENPIGITFEFVNLISDANGCSLATLWNNTKNINKANYNYLNSSIRKALNGTGKATNFLWAQKEATAWSTDPLYKNRTVLDMLPTDLSSVLKTPVKTALCVNNFGRWTETKFSDKLFILRIEEVGFFADESAEAYTYSYYKGHVEQNDPYRIKKQVNANLILNHPTQIPSGAGQLSRQEAFNYAGYNESDPDRGGYSLLRSPYMNSPVNAVWIVLYDGKMNASTTFGTAAGVAPAFCI